MKVEEAMAAREMPMPAHGEDDIVVHPDGVSSRGERRQLVVVVPFVETYLWRDVPRIDVACSVETAFSMLGRGDLYLEYVERVYSAEVIS